MKGDKLEENKFKAWDNQEKFWLDPEHFYITGEGRGFTCEDKKGMRSNVYELMGRKRYKIVQYTGLKDKNGVEIYEGDILCHRRKVEEDWGIDKYVGKVIFTDGRFHMSDHIMDEIKPTQYTIDIEIIGNVYEHPELIKNAP